MEVLHPHCAGLDVHKDSVMACVRHMAEGKIATEVKQFKTTTRELMALSEWLSSEGCTHLAMESTGVYWKPVWHILADGEFELVLANAAHLKNVPGRKTDVKDAAWLAGLLAYGLIRASFVPDEPTRQMRDLLRTRLVRRPGQTHLLAGAVSPHPRPPRSQESHRRRRRFHAHRHLPHAQNAIRYTDLGAGHFDQQAKAKHVLRLLQRLQNLGVNVQIAPSAA